MDTYPQARNQRLWHPVATTSSSSRDTNVIDHCWASNEWASSRHLEIIPSDAACSCVKKATSLSVVKIWVVCKCSPALLWPNTFSPTRATTLIVNRSGESSKIFHTSILWWCDIPILNCHTSHTLQRFSVHKNTSSQDKGEGLHQGKGTWGVYPRRHPVRPPKNMIILMMNWSQVTCPNHSLNYMKGSSLIV